MQDYEISSYLKMIRIKNRLIRDVDKFLGEKRYARTIDLVLLVLYHDLFINDYYPYYKLSQLFDIVEDRKKEREIILEFFKSRRYCDEKTIKYFKNRLINLDVKNADSIIDEYYKSGVKTNSRHVPVLMADDILNIDLQSLKLNSKFSRDFTKFNDSSSVEDKIRFKYKLVKKGDDFLNGKKHLNSLQYFDRLLKHPLFKNDAYPYWCVSEVYKALNNFEARKYYLEKFFHSGIYCSGEQLELFKNALKECNCKNISELIKEFEDNGAKNEYFSNIPVPTAFEISNSYGLVDESLDENIVLESLVKKIPSYYLSSRSDDVLEDTTVDYSDDDNSNIVKLTKIDPNDLKERQLMLNALQLIRTGKSRSEVSKILNIDIKKIFRWIYRGEIGYDVNTYYFCSELNYIETIRRDMKLNKSEYGEVNNFTDVFKETFSNVTLSEIDLEDSNLNYLIKEYEKFFRGSYYNSSIKRYNLTVSDVESIKHRILDEILLEKIKGYHVDFSSILKQYCINYAHNKRRLKDEEFDEIFDGVDDSKVSEIDAYGCRIKTIRDYNANRITKTDIEERFKYHLNKKFKENHQLARLDEIIKNPDVPEIKSYLTESEVLKVYSDTRDAITSQHGLKGIVLDYVKLSMDKIASRKVSMAFDEFEKFKEYLPVITDLNEIQIRDFCDEFEMLIADYEIRLEDITKEYIQKLSENYGTFGKINI